jgi:hypothetical protein
MNMRAFLRSIGVAAATLSVTAMLVSCQKKAEEQVLEKAIEHSTGKSADVDVNGQNVTIETEGKKVEIQANAAEWPDEIPGDVPEFSYGTIKGVTRTETPEGLSWGIVVEKVPDSIVRNYEQTLKNRGFETSSMIMSGENGQGGSVTGEKGNISVVLMAGNGSASLSVALKK